MQARDLKNGKFSATERARLTAAQNYVSSNIETERHNSAVGNPDSLSSERMQADVARNVNQEKRIEGGVHNGSMTNRDLSKAEAGQARVDGLEARAGKNGYVGHNEQQSINRADNRQSRRIYHEKHNAQVRG